MTCAAACSGYVGLVFIGILSQSNYVLNGRNYPEQLEQIRNAIFPIQDDRINEVPAK